jgi:Tol biopolymer transport system component
MHVSAPRVIRFGVPRSWIPAVAVTIASCSGPQQPRQAPVDPDRIAIIAAERGPQGTRLVALDERGERQFDLLDPPPGDQARDTHPALSPDGAWIVFASSRGRRPDVTGLWIAPVAANAAPRRLTAGAHVDSHPTWTRDGSAVIYGSARNGRAYDLYSLAIAGGQPVGEPLPLTDTESHDLMPSTGSDGSVVYMMLSVDGESVASHLVARAADGTVTKLTEGPADTAPALSPDERTIVFARPVQHAAGPDADLWTMPRNGSPSSAAPLIDLPLTDETGPVWSPDGRYVFATSVLRGAQGNPVFSSVIVIDMQERPRKARLLADRLAVIARLTPAITRTPLDAAALAADPEYLPELARIMAAAMANQGGPSTP